MDTTQVRRTLGVLLIGVSLSATACSSTDTEPKASAPVLQTFPDEGFTAEFPSAPKREERQQAAAGMNLNFVLYESGDLVVAYVKYPVNITGSLDGAVNGAAQSAKGTVQSRKDTTFMGHPATDVVIKAPEGVIHSRLVLRGGNRLYTLIGGGESGPPAGYDRLVETFVLL